MTTLSLRVPDMSCGHCVASISEAVGRVDGVEGVCVDLEGKLVEVEGERLEPALVTTAIREAGYEPETR